MQLLQSRSASVFAYAKSGFLLTLLSCEVESKTKILEQMSLCLRKPTKCLDAWAKTKAQISFAVTAKLISAIVFATWIVQSFFFNPKFQASSLLLDCKGWFVSDLVRTQIVGFLPHRLKSFLQQGVNQMLLPVLLSVLFVYH